MSHLRKRMAQIYQSISRLGIRHTFGRPTRMVSPNKMIYFSNMDLSLSYV